MHKMVSTNYLAPMAFVSAFAPIMKERGCGHIINICSTAANDIYPNSSVYCSTKAALAAYTVAARHDLVDTPIRVTSISPGLVDTPLHEKKAGSLDQSRKTFDSVVPLYPEDVADQVVYVSTRAKHVQVADLSSYATNQSHSGAKGVPGVARVGPSLGGRTEEQKNNFPNMQNAYESPRMGPSFGGRNEEQRNNFPNTQNVYDSQRGPMQPDSNSDRDRYDLHSKNSYESRGRSNEPFYMHNTCPDLSRGNGGDHHNGGSRSPSPIRDNTMAHNMRHNGSMPRPSHGSSRSPRSQFEQMNGSFRGNQQNAHMSKGDNFMNNDSAYGQMPGQMPEIVKMTQMPGMMPEDTEEILDMGNNRQMPYDRYDRNGQREPADMYQRGPDRNSKSYDQHQQGQSFIGSSYPYDQQPADQNRYVGNNPQSGSMRELGGNVRYM